MAGSTDHLGNVGQRETLRAATEDWRRRGIDEPSPDTKPEHLVEILAATAERSAPEIRGLFARLLTAAMDPNRMYFYRSEFVEIVKHLEPLDALVLQLSGEDALWNNNWQNKVAKKLDRERDEIELAGRNLERLGCLLASPTVQVLAQGANPTPLARQLLNPDLKPDADVDGRLS